jgi:hypothetical protein
MDADNPGRVSGLRSSTPSSDASTLPDATADDPIRGLLVDTHDSAATCEPVADTRSESSNVTSRAVVRSDPRPGDFWDPV